MFFLFFRRVKAPGENVGELGTAWLERWLGPKLHKMIKDIRSALIPLEVYPVVSTSKTWESASAPSLFVQQLGETGLVHIVSMAGMAWQLDLTPLARHWSGATEWKKVLFFIGSFVKSVRKNKKSPRFPSVSFQGQVKECLWEMAITSHCARATRFQFYFFSITH